jgi:hypothetical protein
MNKEQIEGLSFNYPNWLTIRAALLERLTEPEAKSAKGIKAKMKDLAPKKREKTEEKE